MTLAMAIFLRNHILEKLAPLRRQKIHLWWFGVNFTFCVYIVELAKNFMWFRTDVLEVVELLYTPNYTSFEYYNSISLHNIEVNMKRLTFRVKDCFCLERSRFSDYDNNVVHFQF